LHEVKEGVRKVHEMRVKDKVTVCTLDKKVCKEAEALFDTGASFTCMSKKLAEKLGYTPFKEPKEIPLAVKGQKGLVMGGTPLWFTVAKCEMPLPMVVAVVDGLAFDLVIGTDFMEKFEVKLDLKEGKAKLRKCPPEMTLV
jgi:predicted aspartyl protease